MLAAGFTGVCSAGGPLGIVAQSPRHGFGALTSGDSVRVRLPGALRVEASMRAVRADTIVLAVSGLADQWSLSAFDLESLERYVDRTPSEGFRQGAILGMAAGLFAGAATGLLLHYTGALGAEDEHPVEDLVGTTLKGAGLGAGVGILVGGFFGGAHPGMGWVSIDLPAMGRR